MSETPAERTHRLNANRSPNGLFGTAFLAEPVEALVLPEAPYWDNGGSQNGVTVVESPVSDREKNYALIFGTTGGYINVNPFEFGIESPGTAGQYRGDQDRLYVGSEVDANNDDLVVQFCYAADSEDLASEVEDFSATDLQALEAAIAADLKAEFGDSVVIEFTSGGERWDDVQVMYNTHHLGAQRDLDGRLNAFTSNIMAALEDDDQYLKVRNGLGETIIYNALQKHSVGV